MKMDEIIEALEMELVVSKKLKLVHWNDNYYRGRCAGLRYALHILRQYCADQAPCLDCGTITADGEVLPEVIS